MYVDVNIVEIKFKKFTKRDKLSNSKIKVFTRFFRQSRAERHVFFVMSFSRRSKRIEKNELQKKDFFRVSSLNFAEKRIFFEHVERAMNDNSFVDVNQFLISSSFSSMSKVKNKTIHRDDKLLKFKHIIVKNFENRSKKYVISFLHTFENKCFHCFVYQYNEKCYKKTHKSKY